MTRFRRPAVCPCAFVLATLGALAMLAGAFLDVDHPAFRFGLAVFLIGATGAVVSQKRATERGIEAVRQAAYDAGFREGREVARPVVVPLNLCHVPEHDAATPRPSLARQRLAEAP